MSMSSTSGSPVAALSETLRNASGDEAEQLAVEMIEAGLTGLDNQTETTTSLSRTALMMRLSSGLAVRLEHVLAGLRDASTSSEKLEERVEETRTALHDYAKRIDEARQQHAELTALQDDLKAREDTLSRRQAELADQTKHLRAIEAAVAEAEQRVNALDEAVCRAEAVTSDETRKRYDDATARLSVTARVFIAADMAAATSLLEAARQIGLRAEDDAAIARAVDKVRAGTYANRYQAEIDDITARVATLEARLREDVNGLDDAPDTIPQA